MVLVVMSFAITLAYSHYLVHPIDDQALAISQDSMPRFARVAVIRRELLLLIALTGKYISGPRARQPQARQQIDARLADLRAGLTSYRSLRAISEEQQPLNLIGEDITRVQAAIEKTLDQADAGERDAAEASMDDSVLPLVLQADQPLAQLRLINEQHVRDSTRYIVNLRRHAVRMATTLGLLGIGTAIIATVLVLQGLRGQARLVVERDRLLTARNAELELFAGRVAHDLRDPLNAVGLRLAVLLQSPSLDAETRGSLAKVSGQLECMRGIIDGLLEFARSGARPSAEFRVDLGRVLDEVVASVRPAADAADTELRIVPFPDLQVAVAPAALRSVLSNLLGNAVKYVLDGQELPHRIGVRVSGRGSMARIEVEDNGPGLPPEAQEWVFEPFRRLSSQQPGTGLGLATVRKIVEAYGGTAGVISQLGRGSTFWVEIPMRDTTASTVGGPADST